MVNTIVFSLLLGYRPVAKAYFENGDIRSFNPCREYERAEVEPFITMDTRYQDERFPNRTFESFLFDQNYIVQRNLLGLNEKGNVYDPKVMGTISAIRLRGEDATLAFAFGGSVDIPWTKEGLAPYKSGITGYTVFFDER